MDKAWEDHQLKTKLEFTAVSFACILGLAIVIAAVSLLLASFSVEQYLSALCGMLSGGMLGLLIVRYYLCFEVFIRLFQGGFLAFIGWELFANKIDVSVMIAMFPMVFLYTSLNIKKHWRKLKKLF